MKKVVLTCVMAFGLSLVSNVQADDVVALAKSKIVSAVMLLTGS